METMNRIGLKITCVLAAVLIWIQVAATSVVETVIDLPLQVSGLADGLTVAGSELPTRVPVRLQGSKLRLLAHKYLGSYAGEVRLILADRGPGPAFSYQLGRADVFTDAEVLRLDRETRVRLHIDEEWIRTLPVAPVFTGTWPEDVGLLVPPHAMPDSVRVTGPSRFLAHLERLATAPIERDRFHRSTRHRVVLVEPHEHLRLQRSEVEVAIALAPLVERTLANVPVVPLVDAGQPDVSVSPPVADVMVRGVADSVRALTAVRISVTLAVGDRGEGVYLLPGAVEHPPWLTLLGVSPPRFRAIVGDPPLTAPPVTPEAGDAGAETGGGRP
jgi:YbbR domain-containing protein